MKHILLAVMALGLWGCKTMTATSTCSFTPSKEEGRYYHWTVPGDAKCSFTLNAPIGKSKDVQTFAEAFRTILGTSPTVITEVK